MQSGDGGDLAQEASLTSDAPVAVAPPEGVAAGDAGGVDDVDGVDGVDRAAGGAPAATGGVDRAAHGAPGATGELEPAAQGAISGMVGADDATRTRTRSGSGDDAILGAPASDVTGERRLPAPLQYRDPDRYEIIAEHGRGGLGRVYRARDKELGRDVALKELLSRGSTGELRFFREALITARLEHPGIVPVHEAGRWPDGTPFYAMKLVAGRPLKELIEACTTLEERLALLPHIIAVADAIAYAHDRKIIHRDLKPSNIIVGDFGETVVIDWGLAKDISDQAPAEATAIGEGPFRTAPPADDGVTVAGSVLGTPAYMSPEQARGEPVDERTDVYAIGAILQALCDRECRAPGPFRRPAAISIDTDLLAVIRRSLHPDRKHRYSTARELAHDLRAYSEGLRISSRSYSLPALLHLWYRKNKTLATTWLATALVLSLLGLWAITSVVRERNRASAASADQAISRRVASRQRDQALQAQATLTLERDPTAAHELLRASHSTLSATYTLARAMGEHIAAFSLPLTAPLSAVSASPDMRRIAVATIDRRLTIIDLATGVAAEAAHDLPEFTPLAYSRTGWWYTSSSRARPELRHSALRYRAELPADALTLQATESTALILLTTGHLLATDGQSPPHLLAQNVAAATLSGSEQVLACSRDGRLLRGSAREPLVRSAIPCDPAMSPRTLTNAGDSYVYPSSQTTITVTRGETSQHHTLPAKQPVVAAAAASAGLVALIDAGGLTYFVTSSGEVSRAFDHPAPARSVAAAGSRLAWGYTDGTVLIADTSTGDSWSIRAHTQAVDKLTLSATSTYAISASQDSVRVWDLRRREPRPQASLPCAPFHLARSPASTDHFAIDCPSGEVWMIDSQTGTQRLLHRHSRLAFGLAWHGSTVCSGSWDGTVLCTHATSGETHAVAQHTSPVRWLAADDDVLLHATADGSIWLHSGASAERGGRIATLREEPYRATTYGERVVVATRSGKLVLIDPSRGSVLSATPHNGIASVVQSATGDLFTFGHDGGVTYWRGDKPTAHWPFQGAVRHLRPLHTTTGFAASVAWSHLAVAGPGRTLVLPIEDVITDIIATPSHVAAGTRAGQIVAVDLATSGIASVPLHDGKVQAITEQDDTTIAVATSTGSLYLLNLASLTYTNIQENADNEEDVLPPEETDCTQPLLRLAFRGCRGWSQDHDL